MTWTRYKPYKQRNRLRETETDTETSKHLSRKTYLRNKKTFL